MTEEKRKKMMNNSNNDMNQMMPPSGISPFGMGGGFGMPVSPSPNPFAGGLQNMDIDAMMKDIDQKLKELDEEEKRQKEKLKNQNQSISNESPFKLAEENDLPELELPKEKPMEDKKETPEDVSKSDKPKVNIDVDSVIMNENVITDDEFFDDFFGDE